MKIVLLLILLGTLPGCIPLIAGGFIGYEMAQHDNMCRHHPEECAP